MNQDEIRYQVLHAIDHRQRQYPSNFVSDAQIVEHTGLELQTVQDEMDLLEADGYTASANSFDGKSAQVKASGRLLLQEYTARRAQPPRAREVQQRTLEFLLRYEEAGRPSVLAGSGVWVGGTTIAEELHLGTQLIQDSLENLAERGCVQLKHYTSGPDRLVASLTGRGRTIAREPDYIPSAQAAGGTHITYNQQGQQVTYQYNAAGDINIGAVQNKVELVDQLEKLKAEISKAEEAQVIDADTATEARFEIERAVNQAKKDQPDKKTLVERIEGGAKVLQAAATGAAAVPALIDSLHNIAARIPHLPF